MRRSRTAARELASSDLTLCHALPAPRELASPTLCHARTAPREPGLSRLGTGRPTNAPAATSTSPFVRRRAPKQAASRRCCSTTSRRRTQPAAIPAAAVAFAAAAAARRDSELHSHSPAPIERRRGGAPVVWQVGAGSLGRRRVVVSPMARPAQHGVGAPSPAFVLARPAQH
eukprot:4533708-Prymnesium_polylepis.2